MYARDERYSSSVQVPTAIHPTRAGRDHPNFPSFEAILGADVTLHETWVTCVDTTGREHRFLIAAQYCADCEVNAALKHVLPEVDWRGSLVVMRGGYRSFVVNMGGSVLKKLALAAVHKYVSLWSYVHGPLHSYRFLFETAYLVAASVQQGTPLIIPVEL